MMTRLSTAEKQEMMKTMANYLPSMRKMLRLSQTDFGDLCGVSRARISAIECGEVKMTWYQFNAFLLVLVINPETKKWIINMGVFPEKLYCFYQRKGAEEGPEGLEIP